LPLTISPPLTHEAKWFKPHPPYSIAKYTMSLFTLALAAEFAEHGIAVNSLWPRTVIATAAVLYELGGEEMMSGARKRSGSILVSFPVSRCATCRRAGRTTSSGPAAPADAEVPLRRWSRSAVRIVTTTTTLFRRTR
jgi:NAD(P)-dependent dehydrogenase (short-subunit alcohol dehydrogenase family)